MPARAQQRLVKITSWVHSSVKGAYEHQAQTERLSPSKVTGTTLEEALARQLHIQHAGILEPIIKQAIAKEMRAYSSRLAMLLVRSMFASEQTRALVTNILSRQPGINEQALEEILNGTSNTARRNITRVTPQLATLIEEVERWLIESAEAADETHD